MAGRPGRQPAGQATSNRPAGDGFLPEPANRLLGVLRQRRIGQVLNEQASGSARSRQSHPDEVLIIVLALVSSFRRPPASVDASRVRGDVAQLNPARGRLDSDLFCQILFRGKFICLAEKVAHQLRRPGRIWFAGLLAGSLEPGPS